jgi:hypothetical protein
MAGGGECFWILADTGVLLQVEDFHILAVIRNPHIFLETPESIQEEFDKNNEKVQSNFEGKSRQIIMRRIISRGFIRIRKYKHKKIQYWIIQQEILNEQRTKWIQLWAKYISAHVVDRYADVIIHELLSDNRTTTSLDKLASDKCVSENGVCEIVVLTESQLLELYIK